jgi:hypothetical protein
MHPDRTPIEIDALTIARLRKVPLNVVAATIISPGRIIVLASQISKGPGSHGTTLSLLVLLCEGKEVAESLALL